MTFLDVAITFFNVTKQNGYPSVGIEYKEHEGGIGRGSILT